MIRPLLLLALLAPIAHADEPKHACKEPAADAKLALALKPDVSLTELADWLAGVTCKTVLFDSGIAQHITKVHVVAPRPLTPKQAVQLVVDAIGTTGLVVEQKADTIIVKRGPNLPPEGCPDVVSVDPVDRDADELAAEIAKGVVVVDETHRRIDRALVDKILANPMAISKGARVVPAIKDGKPQGFKLYAIRPTSLYAKLGLTNGDTLITINGFDLTSADKALEVYTKLRDATSIEIDLIRRGKPVVLYFTIK